LIQKLQTERQEHLDAVANIDATFEQFGISVAPVKRRGRPRKSAKPGPRRSVAAKAAQTVKPAKKGKRKARRKFPVSGLDSILAFVKSAGKKGVTTAEIVKYWKAEGRSGDGYTTLGELVTAKKLKREKIEGAKGSRYTVV
jgi:hypothetical protein